MKRSLSALVGLALFAGAGSAAAQFYIERPSATVSKYYDHGDGTWDGRKDYKCEQDTYAGHKGTDYIGSPGAAVNAAQAGWVVRSVQGWPNNEGPKRPPAGCDCAIGTGPCDFDIAPGGGWGNHVTLLHPGGYTTTYAHMTGSQATWGTEVGCGTQIGQVGLTGCTSGYHFHLEARSGVDTNNANRLCGSAQDGFAPGLETPGGSAVDPEDGTCNASSAVRYGSCSTTGVDELASLCGCWSRDAVRFVSETIPDNTVFTPATTSSIDKTWTVENSGTSVWEPGTIELRFVGSADPGTDCLQGCSGDDQLGGADAVAVQTAVSPGGQVTFTVSLDVPQASGAYRGSWRMYNTAEDKYFGECLWFAIQVQSGPLPECPSARFGTVENGDMVQSADNWCPGGSYDGCGYWWRCSCEAPDCTKAKWECALPPDVAPPPAGVDIHPLSCASGSGGSGGSGGAGGSSGGGGEGGRPILPPPDPEPSPLGLCWSATLAQWVEPGTCVQVTYPSGDDASCGWRRCNDGGFWGEVEADALSTCTSQTENTACVECTDGDCPSECEVGTDPLPQATSACTAAVCSTDGYESCCSSDGAWDEDCVALAQTTSGFCRGVCYDASAENTCAHDECTPGAKLSETCSPCAEAVCAIDPFCCSSEWDTICATITAKRNPYCWCPG